MLVFAWTCSHPCNLPAEWPNDKSYFLILICFNDSKILNFKTIYSASTICQ